MKFDNNASADQIVCPKGLTVGKLHAFLTEVMAVGKEHVQVFLNDGSDYSPTLALGSVRLDEKDPEAFITAAVVPENKFEAVVVDCLRSLDDGYVCLTGSHPALAVEKLDMVYEQMVKRTDPANDSTMASANVKSMSKQPESDPFVDELTVGAVQELIENGLSSGTLTEDSPFRIHVNDSYIIYSALTFRTKDDSGIAEPINDYESAALETYARCNVNHVLLHGDAVRSNNQHMYHHIRDMKDRAVSIPGLTLEMPLAA